ncbi:MAG: class I SAM-dependent rRNA methyltransferase [Calditrichaeota bacterium]|nr:class I SAM-dependent rRNA methyltransferase [Calditrichota bacterium]
MSSFARVILKRGAEKRILAGHVWIFESLLLKTKGPLKDGDIVEVESYRGDFLGRGYFNHHSNIVVRLLTRKREPIDFEFFKNRIHRAFQRRHPLLQATNAYRVIFSEADFLPGLIIDRYGDIFVLQILTLGIERFRNEIVDVLVQLFQPAGIFERSDARQRTFEGLPLLKQDVWGSVPERVEFLENGLTFFADVREGQKTGFFLDQRDNRLLVRQISARARVLDCFSYSGGFSVSAAKGGAREVIAVDISETAIEQARENARRNHVADKITFRPENVFDLLKHFDKEGEKFDVIILDPPAFVRSKKAIEGALRGYKEINLRAMRLLNPNGYLLTSSCSHNLSENQFHHVLFQAAADVHRSFQVLQKIMQPLDHPILLTIPETYYLKSVLLQYLEF